MQKEAFRHSTLPRLANSMSICSAGWRTRLRRWSPSPWLPTDHLPAFRSRSCSPGCRAKPGAGISRLAVVGSVPWPSIMRRRFRLGISSRVRRPASTAHGFLAWATRLCRAARDRYERGHKNRPRQPGAFLSNRMVQLRRIPPNLGIYCHGCPKHWTGSRHRACAGGIPQRDVISGARQRHALRYSANRNRGHWRGKTSFCLPRMRSCPATARPRPARLGHGARTGTTTPSLLQLDDVVGLNIDADLVLLSACNTAASATLRGDPLSGLTDGFSLPARGRCSSRTGRWKPERAPKSRRAQSNVSRDIDA